jgi:hypothetical protein
MSTTADKVRLTCQIVSLYADILCSQIKEIEAEVSIFYFTALWEWEALATSAGFEFCLSRSATAWSSKLLYKIMLLTI